VTLTAPPGPPVRSDEGPGSGTVAELIGGPDPDATRAAAKHAGVHAFILELPQGYDTLAGPGGLPLAPAIRRHLELARRLARRAAAGLGAAEPADGDPRLSGPGPPLPPDDPGLPGFGRLLDTGAMAPILARALGVQAAPLVRVRSVRYKPGKNAVAHYDVGTGSAWLEAVAYTTAGAEELVPKASRQPKRAALAAQGAEGRPATPSPISYELEIGALLQWLPLDMRLKGLAKTGAQLRRRLADAGLAVHEHDEPELLRYWARRRAVLGFGDHVIKLYREPLDLAAAEVGLRAASGLAGVPTARFEAVLPSLKATVQRRVPGAAPRLGPAGGAPVGDFLARLHRADPAPLPGPLPACDAADLLAKAATRAQFVAQLLPGLEASLTALLAALEARRPRELPLVPSHGNFHAGQLLETGESLVMIDVDRLCLSHAGFDVASYAGHLAFGHAAGEEEVMETALAALVEGYGSRPDALGWFLAICLLRRAPVPFRYQDERWPDATAGLIRSAHRALEW
jgi:phosphotransferase family enzyme